MTTKAARNGARRILVTGAGSGLGLALATKLAARGDQVLATSLGGRRPETLPVGIDYQSHEVCSDEDWARALDHVNQTWGGLDVLVNNAGIAAVAPVDTASMAMWDHKPAGEPARRGAGRTSLHAAAQSPEEQPDRQCRIAGWVDSRHRSVRLLRGQDSTGRVQ